MTARGTVSRDARHEALEELTGSVARLVDASVTTGVDTAVLREVAGAVDALCERLEGERDDDAWSARSYGPGFADPQRVMGINPAHGLCNPLAPIVELTIHEDASVTGTIVFRPSHVGPPGRVHGGIVALAFDGILGLATIAAGAAGFTKSMTVRYLRATPLEVPVRFEVRFDGIDGRTSRATAKMFDEDGTVTAEADAVFVGRGETST